MDIFMYTGNTKEVQVNSPYKIRFKSGEKKEVTKEMAAVLETHPEFRKVSDKKNRTEFDRLLEMKQDQRQIYVESKSKEMEWRDFQEWGFKTFGVRDTSKHELVKEILDKLEEG